MSEEFKELKTVLNDLKEELKIFLPNFIRLIGLLSVLFFMIRAIIFKLN